MAKTGIILDDREWKRAMADYTANTSKTFADAVNGKHRDWLWKSVKYMPKADRQKVREAASSWRLAAWHANWKYGAGQWDQADLAAERKSLRRRVSSVSYMRHILAKAGGIFPPTKTKAGRERRPTGYAGAKKRKNIKSRAKYADPRKLGSLVNEITTTYGAREGGDAAQKDRLLQKALRQSRAEVLADMKQHLAGKSARLARKYSA